MQYKFVLCLCGQPHITVYSYVLHGGPDAVLIALTNTERQTHKPPISSLSVKPERKTLWKYFANDGRAKWEMDSQMKANE